MEEVFGLSFLIGLFGAFAFFLIIIPLVLYIVNALALTKIADNRGFDKGWLAWIPIANILVIPMMIEDDVHESLQGKFTLVIGGLFVATLLPFIGALTAIALFVLSLYGFYVLVNQYTDNAVAYVVISVVFGGLAAPFLLFRIRNREMITE